MEKEGLRLYRAIRGCRGCRASQREAQLPPDGKDALDGECHFQRTGQPRRERGCGRRRNPCHERRKKREAKARDRLHREPWNGQAVHPKCL